MKKILAGAALFALLLSLGVLTLVLPERAVSESENRTLAAFSSLSLSDLRDGDLQEKLARALSDQFPGRDRLMELGTALKKLSGRRDVGGVYLGRDGCYFEKITNDDIDIARFEANVGRVEALAEAFPDLPVTMLLVPAAGAVLAEELPPFAPIYDSAALCRRAAELAPRVAQPDPTAELRRAAKTARVYYRTDHHWTAAGAYAGYLALTDGRGAYGPLRGETVSRSFLGTLHSATQDAAAVPDEIFLPEAPEALYDRAKLAEKDQYQVFLGGNTGRAEIRGEGEGTLLLVKDSFANCFVPYLTADWGRIIAIDLRFGADSAYRLLAEGEADAVLVLYEQSNFANDTALAKLAMK